MKEQKKSLEAAQPSIQLKPIISYPRTAEAGERYLLTIDVQLAEGSPWPYPEEEFAISFILETAPFFTHEPLGEHEPGIVLHRFGGTYGPAEYLLTAAKRVQSPGHIKITLLNAWGLPIAHLELECEVKKDAPALAKRKVARKNREEESGSQLAEVLSPVLQPSTDSLISRQLAQVGWQVLEIPDSFLRNYRERPPFFFHIRVRQERERRGWTQEYVGEMIGVTPITVRRWEARESYPALPLLQKMYALFETDAVGMGILPKIVVPPGNIALKGYPSLENDYLLFMNQKVVGYVAAYPEFECTKKFKEAYEQLSEYKKERTVDKIYLLINNPSSPALHLHRYKTEENIWECHIDRTMRLIYMKQQEEIRLVDLGDEAELEERYDRSSYDYRFVLDERDSKIVLSMTKGTNLAMMSLWHVLHRPPFEYRMNGEKIIFRNYLERGDSSRRVYTFHQPATLARWLDEAQGESNDLFRTRLQHMPALKQVDLFDYQFEALWRLERSLADGQTRVLVEIQNGLGKTHAAVHTIYRLLEYAKARRIFYVVDDTSYVLDALQRFIPPDDPRKFTDKYNVRVITDKKLNPSVHVYIGPLDDLYRLYSSGPDGQHLPMLANNPALAEVSSSVKDYCPDLPIEYFDVIFFSEDEYIHDLWQPVLDYFDTCYIGIVSKVSQEALKFFNNNLVYPAVDTADVQGLDPFAQRQMRISQILRGVYALLYENGVAKVDSLYQLSWLLFLKYLDDFEQAQEALQGTGYVSIMEPKYRWHSWANEFCSSNISKDYETLKIWYRDKAMLEFVDDDLLEYLARLRGENNRDLRTVVSNIFRNVYNHVRYSAVLYEVVNKLDGINFNSSDDMRAASLEYETLLNVVSKAARAPDFYTPRPLVRFIIDRLNPQLGEVVLDPACGTAGFLIEAYERLASQARKPEEIRQLQRDVQGIEREALAYLLAIMNMLLHGIEAPNVFQQDALMMDIQQFQGEEYVDVIATNPPFGGEEYESILESYSDSIRTTDATLLFLQYSMSLLKRPGGRCAIVIPRGFLFHGGAFQALRRRLLIQFNLHTIICLPAGVFSPYTGIATTILFFEAGEGFYNEENSCTRDVWYYEIPPPEGQPSYSGARPLRYEDFHDCILGWVHRQETAHSWKVPVAEILANDANLDYKNPHL